MTASAPGCDVPAYDAPAYDVVALVASAGGLEALGAVLAALPAELPAAVLVQQHLGPQHSTLVEILQRRSALPVAWAADGAPVVAGRVLVCPARSALAVDPDGTCAVTPAARGALDRPGDLLLDSLAASHGARALAVVLTGMGRDGADGVRALKAAGGTVFAQSEDTAVYPSMPRAAAATGAVDLVLPLHEIGPVLADVVARGRPLPRSHAERDAARVLFAPGGAAGARLAAVDWAATPLGPVRDWPAALRTVVGLTLAASLPTALLWGPSRVRLSNAAFDAFLASDASGGDASDAAGDTATYERVQRGEPVVEDDVCVATTRGGEPGDVYVTRAHVPVRDEAGQVRGALVTLVETTTHVLGARRTHALRELTAHVADAPTERDVLARVARVLGAHAADVPFALAYRVDAAHGRAELYGTAGFAADAPAAPRALDLAGGHPVWPVADVVRTNAPVLVDNLGARVGGLGGRGGAGSALPAGARAAFVMPLRGAAEDDAPAGVLALGVSPRLPFDDAYRGFFELAATQIAARLAAIRAAERERGRAEALAALDRDRTEFFSNVSHEFRTPLTLVLGPLDDALEDRDAPLAGAQRERAELARRSARRLLRQVDTLLDVSRLEAGRRRPNAEPVDLAAYTAELAEAFRAAAERAGLRFVVDCPPLPEPVWVDRELWEKVVFNLIANALTFTFTGEIEVRVRALREHAELTVRDTGVGIPAADLPHVFARFHRVRGARGRTQEGTGIGLALVHDAVALHHGRVRVRSVEGEGSTFTVWLLRGERSRGEHDQIAPRPAPEAPAASVADAMLGWAPAAANDAVRPAGRSARVLVADDNADMRDYMARLVVGGGWQAEAVADGAEAVAALEAAAARGAPFDLVVADVVMPVMDGYALLRHVRGDPRLCALPVVLVTAYAGEEAIAQGLLAGADDYVAKPFSSRELVARLGAQLELARLRRPPGPAGGESDEREGPHAREPTSRS